MEPQTIPSSDAKVGRPASRPASVAQDKDEVIMDCKIDELFYGSFKAVRDTSIPLKKNSITAFIGPSGCGKSTVLRCLNRMNDLVRGFRFSGHVHYRGRDIYDPAVDPVAVRRYIGMVFQQPNPFATSIYNNVAFGLRLNGFKGNTLEKVEKARRGALGRGEGQAAAQRSLVVGRAAAAALHRSRDCDRAGGASDGRAVFGT